MKVYVISLERTPERLEFFIESTLHLGLDIELVKAVDGQKLSQKELELHLGRRSTLFGLGKGEVGCFLSHRNAWERIAAGPDSWAFIAEDDIHLSEDSEPFFKDSAWIPVDADLVKAETVLSLVEISWWKKHAVYGRDVCHLRSKHTGAAGYFLSKRAAGQLLERTSATCDPVDQLIFNPLLGIASEMIIYQIVPAFCIQDFLYETSDRFFGHISTLDDERSAYGIIEPVKKKPRGMAKVWREISRLYSKPRDFIRYRIINRSIVTRITFECSTRQNAQDKIS